MEQQILYVGQMINIEDMEHYSGVSVAGALFEWNSILGLSKKKGIRIQAVTVPPVASWPRDKKILYKKGYHILGETVKTVNAGFLNVAYIKQFFQMISVYCICKKMIKKNPNIILVSYNTFPQIGIPVYRLARKYGLRHVCILADLPYDDAKSPNWLRWVIWRCHGGVAWKLISYCREFVLLNQKVESMLPENSRCTIVEGGIDPKEYCHPRVTCVDEMGRKIIMYAGALTEYSGVMQLIQAVCSLKNDDLVLHIYGNGDCRDYVEQAANDNQCVVYKGTVSVDKIRNLQANAWLLVNPRPVDSQISKVTFPSKILEYMASGTPVLSTKINALTKPYLEKMFVSETSEPKDLADQIQQAYDTDSTEYERMGQQARDFVIREKSWEIQTQKIQSFIFDIEASDRI